MDLENKCCLGLGFLKTESETDLQVLWDKPGSERKKIRKGKDTTRMWSPVNSSPGQRQGGSGSQNSPKLTRVGLP